MRFTSNAQRKAVMMKLNSSSGMYAPIQHSPSSPISDNDRYEDDKIRQARLIAESKSIYLSNNKRYNTYYDKNMGADYTGKELISKPKNAQEIIKGNRPVLIYADEIEQSGNKQYSDNYGALTDFGYDRKAKKYFIQLERVDYPSSVGMTGQKIFIKYFNKNEDVKLYRIHKEMK